MSRNIIFKDKTISQEKYNILLKEYGDFLQKNTGITPTFITVDYDYTDYPTELDSDGDDRPTFLQDLSDDVDEKYGEWGVDNIVTMIHQDNWKSGKTATRKGIWGTNFSYRYNNYHVQYIRWDKKNPANSFGTLYHEQHHSFDALIKQEIGIDVNSIVGVKSWDAAITHGGEKPWTYIRYQENIDSLKKIAPYLVAAYKKRQDRHDEAIKGMKVTIIGLLEKLVYLYKAKLNQKNGNPKK